jgi:hypothetical protein
MAESNFALFGAAAADIKRGVTAGITPPNGGGNFIFGFNSQVTTASAAGVYYDETNFSPLRDDASNATGGTVRAALKRGVSPSATGYSVGLFICLQGASVPSENDQGYILGLENNDPSAIVLAKTSPISGLDSTLTTALRTSSTTYTWDNWLQLRLDAIVNPNGDVVLKCFQNDVDTNPVTSPSWEAITGMDDFVDDALGVNSGSNPLAGGWGGFAFYAALENGRGYVDQFAIHRQR